MEIIYIFDGIIYFQRLKGEMKGMGDKIEKSRDRGDRLKSGIVKM